MNFIPRSAVSRNPSRWIALSFVLLLAGMYGCATIRVTDPPRTADEEFLINVASAEAVSKLSAASPRDRKVFVDTTYLTASTQPSDDQQYMLGELRSKLLLGGVRLTKNRDQAEIVMEVRSQGISNNHIEFLLGVPASSVGGIFTGGIAAQTPELSILKRTTQLGFASVAYIAYWADTGEVVASSGPFVGRTKREDWWFFGYGPNTTGDIPPAQPAPLENTGGTAETQTEKKTQPAPEKTPDTTPPPAYRGKGPG